MPSCGVAMLSGQDHRGEYRAYRQWEGGRGHASCKAYIYCNGIGDRMFSDISENMGFYRLI